MMSRATRRLAALAFAAAAIALVAAGTAPAALIGTAPSTPSTLIAKATPDECWGSIGNAFQPFNGSCAAGRTPKVDQSYVWGMVKTGNDVWFGTAANVGCIGSGAGDPNPAPLETPDFVCEFGKSDFRTQFFPGLSAAKGDWRPPIIYRMANVATAGGIQPGRTATGLQDKSASLTGDARDRLNDTLGLRAAGAIGNLVFVAGPSLDDDAVHIFAFDRITGAFLGSHTFEDLRNIRRFTVVNNQLYTVAGVDGGGGRLLRFDGGPGNLFDFVTVGTTPSDAVEMTAHQGRIYVGTWPDNIPGPLAGVFQTATVPAIGGLPQSTGPLRRIWTASDYEPDPDIAQITGTGAMASFRGQLVWGTMQVPFTGLVAHLAFHSGDYPAEGPSELQLINILRQTSRATSLFSATALEPSQTPRLRLLYGERFLPVYNTNLKAFVPAPNHLGTAGALGHSGFGNDTNTYTWSMAVTSSGLNVGTLDWQKEIRGAGPLGVGFLLGMSVNHLGGDLFRFPNGANGTLTAAQRLSDNGMGNENTAGLRNMVGDASRLFVGTASGANKNGSPGPTMGGWELRRLTG